jgi:eukaryotic-like serine/threonine-protein kinase
MSDRWHEVKRVFAEALERAPSDRGNYLHDACGGDADLRHQVESLLAAHQTSDRFLEVPPAPLGPAFAQRSRQLGEGQRLGDYEVLRVLGRGGMATVYLARDHRHQRSVALKVLAPELAHAVGSDRFLREIQVAANLSHPHILPLFGSGEVDGLLYYAMPYVEGESLRDRLGRETQLPIDEALQIAREVADALAYAHGQGVIHRDIKPENILLTGDHALVADFGIAHVLGAGGGERLTETGMALGTVAYMSPEQASGAQRVDGRADLYSLGCVVYEMLSGEQPYTGRTPQAIIAKRLSDPVPSVRRLRASVRSSVEHALTRALAPVPADRFATVADFARALTSPDRGPALGHVSRWPRTRIAKTPLIAGAIAVTAVMAALMARDWKGRVTVKALDANLVAVAPFRVTSADSRLAYLREGMVDLLAAKLTGEGGPRASDPRSVLTAWRKTSNSDMADVPQAQAVRLAEGLGAGQLIVGDVVGSSGHIALNASVLTVPAGRSLVQTSVEGPVDSLPALVDRLAARLLTLGAQEGVQRVASLTSTSLPALRLYLDGQGMYRRGRYQESVIAFGRSLDLDSTFALAALGLLVSSMRTGDFEPTLRGERLASAGRSRLNLRDQAYLDALIGTTYSDSIPYSEVLRRAEAFVAVAPDRAEAFATLAEVLFNFGSMVGVDRALERSAAAYRRALELDSTYAPALDALATLSARFGDTLTLHRVARLYHTIDLKGGPPLPVRWRMAVALHDSVEVGRIRSKFDSMEPAELDWIAQLSQYDGVLLEDAEKAQHAWLRRESRGEYRAAMLMEMATLALNRGRPSEATGYRRQQVGELGALLPAVNQVLDALYWDGDTATAASAVHDLESMARRTPHDTLRVGQEIACVLEQWRMAHGRLGTTPAAIALLRKAGPNDPASTMVARGCAILLDAILASAERRSDDAAALGRLDSLMQGGFPYHMYDQAWNLVAARLHEARKETTAALAATRRRLYLMGEPMYLSSYLREEGRLAATVGEREEAVAAYQHYLALRSDPEPSLRPRVEQVRADLAQLLKEPERQPEGAGIR